MATPDYTALGLARAGIPLRGYGDATRVETYHDRIELYQQLRLRLDFFDESIVMTRFSEAEPVSCYEVAPAALAGALTGLPVATGLLPEGILFYGRSTDERIGIYLPPARRTLHLHLPVKTIAEGLEELEIPLPGLVFVGQGRDYSVWAVKERPVDEAAPLYHAPFPNVYREGKICVGDVDMPVCSPTTIHQAAQLFLESYFNDHLAGSRSAKHAQDVLALWHELAAAQAAEYPLDDLVKTNKTVGDLWKI